MNDVSHNQGNQATMVQPYYMQAPYEDDEINLVDLWVTLSAYKRQFFTVFFIVFAIGAVYSLFAFKENYELTTAIQIGTYQTGGGEVAIESPESLLSKITNSIEPVFTKKWKMGHEYEKNIKTSIANPKASNVIVIKNKMPIDQVTIFDDYQLKLSEAVIDDHKKIIVALQAKLFSDLAIAKLKLNELENPLFLKIKMKALEINLDAEKIKLQKLQDPQFFGIKKNQFKNKIITAKHILDLAVGKSGVIEKKLLNLNETKKIIKKNIDELSSLIKVAHKNKKRALKKATELNAMSLLLIDNEIQQNQNRLLTLEERYYVGIENERSDLQEKLESSEVAQIDQQNAIAILDEKYKEMILNNTLNIAQQKLAIDKINLSIQRTKFNTQLEVKKHKQSIAEMQTKLDNYNQTRIVANPSVSQNTVGLSKKILLVLFIFISGFIAFIVILVLIFLDKIKQRKFELANEIKT